MSYNNFELSKSSKKDKKWSITFMNTKTKRENTVHFGAKGYSDYTIHNDDVRKSNYLKRHRKRENWTKSGMNTAGFWSRYLLWNKKTVELSKKNIEDRFNIKISYS